MTNIIIMADAYKYPHFLCYPDNSEYNYSYIEARGGDYDNVVFFGIQMFLKEYLSKPITQADIDFAEEVVHDMGLPFNRAGWEHILAKHGGFLPVEVKTLPEGTVVRPRTVLLSITNTDPACFWLPGCLETCILRAIWYPTTVASRSFNCKLAIMQAMARSSENAVTDFKLHDFGARGATSHESASIGGVAHLLNFQGTDTTEGVAFARQYYNTRRAGFSIPAAEHSTITSWGRENEKAAYERMLDLFLAPGKLVAVVSDSYDLMRAVREIWGTDLRDRIATSGGTVVVRPDSGDPLTIPIEVIEALAERFGYTVNAKGFKVLPDCVRVIQGDGITGETLPMLLDNLLAAGWSADNLAFGMGGGLLQMLNRDTCKFAMKCSAMQVDDIWRDVVKDPITDHSKRSKAGRFAVVEEDGSLRTVALKGNEHRDVLQTVFRDGQIVVETTLAEVRERAHAAALRLAA